MTDVYLASGSPRRQELLAQLGVSLHVSLRELKKRVAKAKARNSMSPVWRGKRRWQA